MKINVALHENYKDQIEILRQAWYPNSTEREVHNSFLLSEASSRFAEDNSVLLPYIEKDNGADTIQRMVAIRETSYKKIQTISEVLDKPVAKVTRSLLAWWCDRINNTPQGEISTITKFQILESMLADMEIELFECIGTLNKLRAVVRNELEKEVAQHE